MDERQPLPLLGIPADRRRRSGRREGAAMKPFVYTRAGSMAEALDAASRSDVAILAGGTELLNWMRIGVREPREVVDIGRLPGGGEIRLEGDVVHIGALATLSHVAAHELVRDRFPVLSQAIQKSASAQLRNL